MTVEMFLHEIPPLLIYMAVGPRDRRGEPRRPAARRDHAGHRVAAVVAPRAGHLAALDRGVRQHRRHHRRHDRLLHRPPGGQAAVHQLGRRFPKHFSPAHVALAERIFVRWGVYAVFFGRFIALLRIFAGPLAGALKMPYYKFLAANISGGIVWAAGTTRGVLPRRGRGDVAEAVLLDRAGRGAAGRADHRLGGQAQDQPARRAATPTRNEQSSRTAPDLSGPRNARMPALIAAA